MLQGTVEQSCILVGQDDDCGLIRVNGRASFKNAPEVKAFLERSSDVGITHFIFDLEECTYMDSTFMGVMAGLAMQLREEEKTPLKLINVGPKNREILETLGLQYVLEIEDLAPRPVKKKLRQTQRLEVVSNKDEISQVMLEAHENLVKAEPKNAEKFKDVISFLREKLGVESI